MRTKIISILLFLLVLPIVNADTWACADCDHRMEINITNPSQDWLTFFPLYVNVTKQTDMMANFSDVIFYNGTCGIDPPENPVLQYHFENYTDKNADFWVQVMDLNPAGENNSICMYYGSNTSYMGDVFSTYDGNQVFVYHMNETSGTNIFDVTGMANDGATNMSSANLDQNGWVVNGITEFYGDDFINITGYKGVAGQAQRTWMGWFNATTSPTNDDQMIFSYGLNGSNGRRWYVKYDDDGGGNTFLSLSVFGGALLGTTELGDGALHHLAIAGYGSDLNTYVIYIDGEVETLSQNDSIVVNTVESDTIMLGRLTSDDKQYFTGIMDEVRFSDTARSWSWINTTYRTMLDNYNWVKFSGEEDYIPPSESPTVIIFKPVNTNYTYTINLPYIFKANHTSLQSCWWSIDNGETNYTEPCSTDVNVSGKFSVDYNDFYTFWAYANASDGSEGSASIGFDINNNFSAGMAKALSAGLIIMFGLALFFVTASKLSGNSWIKPLYFLFSIIMSYASIQFAMVLADEYIKSPSMYSALSTISFAILYGIFLPVLLYFILTPLYDILINKKVVNNM